MPRRKASGAGRSKPGPGRASARATATAKKPARGLTRTKKSRSAERPGPAATDRATEKPAVAHPADDARRFPVVGIGASAGGLEALDQLLAAMPADTGMAFIVVTHQRMGHTSLLPELLGKVTSIPVREAGNGTVLEPNHVYVGPAGMNVAVVNGILYPSEPPAKNGVHLPIDFFLRSLAADQRENAICIVLSGTGTDGTLGLRAVKGESGMAMVQETDSAKYPGMPASAIATGLADYVLPPSKMPEHLVEYAKGPYLWHLPPTPELPPAAEAPVQEIMTLLRNRTKHDFSLYKMSTIRRRIERRVHVHRLEDLQGYVRYLRASPVEIDLLFKELLIGVTSFFRDREAFEALAERALPALVASRPKDHVFRLWVPGCASGEEVFSLAILLRECTERLKHHGEVQIFGTDLDAEAIETARTGRYPDGIAADVSPERLERWFTREGASFRIRKEIREMAVFAQQNVIRDPPFTRIDLLSCRNLLIYLHTSLQQQLLRTFHYALRAGGVLFLGPSESVGSATDMFETIDREWKIHRRLEVPVVLEVEPRIARVRDQLDRANVALPVPAPRPAEPQIPRLLERLLLTRFAPATVVVDQSGEIVYIHGHTGAYLELASGQPHLNIVALAREGLRISLAAALRRAATTDKQVLAEDVRIKSNGGDAYVDVSIERIREPKAVRGLLTVTFRPTPPPRSRPAKRQSRMITGRVQALERELRYSKESLQTTIEDLGTSNEELRSANEELQSMNEELQSANEELETSKEEMQALNEELATVNAELLSKVDELSYAHDDMQNLLNSTDIATVFLDNDLNVKRYTDQTRDLIRLIQSDIGRPVGDLVSHLKYQTLVRDCREVLDTLVSKELEVETTDGAWYLLRIRPYRTGKNVIDGLVVTFVNITKPKAARAFAESIVDTVHAPLVVLDPELRIVSCNRAFHAVFGTTPESVRGVRLDELDGRQWNLPELRRRLQVVLPENRPLEDFELKVQVPARGERHFVLNARRLEHTAGASEQLILLAIEDVTRRETGSR
jgi:two-component system, chemotaxis family, CheB/CheR fusion protein